MYSMLQSGIEFIKALKLSAALIQNHRIRSPIESLVEQIKGGKKIADVFSQVHFLPEIVPNMLRVGEGGGNLEEIFFELYQVFDERFKNSTKRALILIEPAIIVIMGLIVGFIVISLILTVMISFYFGLGDKVNNNSQQPLPQLFAYLQNLRYI